MRQETNNEIDLLLRRLSRREGIPASDGESRINSDHLDADELSSYAENVLPAAARARYTEHLADCSRCRELVVQLSASVPVVAAKETLPVAGSSGLRNFLASLFSPMVLRYAVPALGLIVAAVIGVAVLRSRDGLSSVAQLQKAPQQAPAAAPSEDPNNKGFMNDSAGRVESQSPAATPELQAKTTKQAEAPAVPAPSATPSVSNERVEPKTDAPVQKNEPQAVANAAPPSQSPPKAAETVDEMRVDIQGRKPTPQAGLQPGVAAAREKNLDAVKADDKKAEEQTLAPASAKARRADPRAAGESGGRTQGFVVDGEKEKAKDRDDGVVRSVAGRRFRKQGGIWVDTAYDSSSAIMNIARGSEQYRALVADEPSIKTIADQLDGTIVVVWKGRTYRIR